MLWLDVAGPPGVGKSTLCDPIWGPHDIPIKDVLPPSEWHDFCNEITRLLGLVQKHSSFVAAVRMNRRSMRKMASVQKAENLLTARGPEEWDGSTYIQTGFVQRGLGFGWRLNDMGIDINELRHFFRLMPVSIGVAMLHSSPETVAERNKAREGVKETAHENRAFMVPLMQPAIELAKECLNERDVPVIEIDTSGDVEASRARLIDFASQKPCDSPPAGSGGEIPVLSTPAWW